jgi:hypothetical protein
VEASVVEDTLPAANGQGGWGIHIQDDPDTKARANVTVRACHVAHNREIGVVVSGADATVEACVIEDRLPNANGQYGRGINIQEDLDTKARATLKLLSSLVTHNAEVGILIVSSDATVLSSIIRDTAANSDGLFGDGISVVALDGPASATITGTQIENSARAGLSNLGGTVTLTKSAVLCSQAFAIQRETYNGTESSFAVSLDSDRCGCPVADGRCSPVSAHLEPPPPVDPMGPTPQH